MANATENEATRAPAATLRNEGNARKQSQRKEEEEPRGLRKQQKKRKRQRRTTRKEVVCGIICLVGSIYSIIWFQTSAICQYETKTEASTMDSLFGSTRCVSRQERKQQQKNTDGIDTSSTDKIHQQQQGKHHKRRKPKRLFLGIFTTFEKMSDRQLCHMIRNTYLNFYTELLPHIQTDDGDDDNNSNNDNNVDKAKMVIPKVCKWEVFMKSLQDSYKRENNETNYYDDNNGTSIPEDTTPIKNEHEDCHIVYTFITNASNRRIKAKIRDPFYTPNKYTVDPSTIDNNIRYVGDMIFLDQKYQTTKYPKSIYDDPKVMFGKYERTQPCLSKVLALYEYLWYMLSNDDDSSSPSLSSSMSLSLPPIDEIFDYIAYTDSRVMLYPTQIFPMTNDQDNFWYKDDAGADADDSDRSMDTAKTSPSIDGKNLPFYLLGGLEADEKKKELGNINQDDNDVNPTFSVDEKMNIHRTMTNLTSLPRLKGDVSFDRYVILSTSLYKYVMKRIIYNPMTVFDGTAPGIWIARQIKKHHRNALILQSKRMSMSSSSTTTTTILNSTTNKNMNSTRLTTMPEQHRRQQEQHQHVVPPSLPRVIYTKNVATGAKILETEYNYELANAFLTTWEEYKDSMLEYKPFSLEELNRKQFLKPSSSLPQSSQSTSPTSNYWLSKQVNSTTFNGPRILMGIFSMDAYKEAGRRDVIRNSYLNYYNIAHGEDDNRNRICSLQMFTSNGFVREQCQLVYTFVLGGRGLYDENGMSSTTTNATTNLVDIYNRLEEEKRYDELPPMTVEPYPLIQKTENTNPVVKAMEPDDIVFLNIHENMNDGKSPTWIMYANRIKVIEYDEDGTRNEIPFLFDYIAKIDSDTVLYPEIFLDEVFSPLPSFPHNARYYGGDVPVVRTIMGLLVLGPYFFQGSFYIMSWDLAEYVTSPRCIRDPWDAKKEDRSMGNWIRTYPLPIRTFLCSIASVHPVKRISEYRSTWNKHVQKRHPENIVT